jgi:hypothetical protein
LRVHRASRRRGAGRPVDRRDPKGAEGRGTDDQERGDRRATCTEDPPRRRNGYARKDRDEQCTGGRQRKSGYHASDRQMRATLPQFGAEPRGSHAQPVTERSSP